MVECIVDVEATLSIENDTLQSRNESLERSIAELKEQLNQEVAPSGGNILTNVACTLLKFCFGVSCRFNSLVRNSFSVFKIVILLSISWNTLITP
jgi:cell division protein FtsB